MNLVRYNPGLRNLSSSSFNSILDRFFNDTFDDSQVTRGSNFSPAVDIVEKEKAFELELAVPGMKKEDFNIDFKDGKLTISGDRKFEKEDKEVNYHTRETGYGAFSRSFYLPESVEDSKIKASYEDGILKLVLPKDTKKELTRTIKVG